MKKIPCLFKREFGEWQQLITREINPICQWVSDGEGYATRKYDELKEYLSQVDMEGLVFYHEDGRMAKIRKSDFGIKR